VSNALDNKLAHKAYLDGFAHPDTARFRVAVATFFAADAKVNVVHPINDVAGAEGFQARVVSPMEHAFEGLYRRNDILIGGTFEDGDWVSSMGYFAGKWVKPWLGLTPSGKLTYIRVGEFHRMENGQAVESYIYIDLPELMIRTEQWPLKPAQGFAGHIPGPATQDGILAFETAPEDSEESLRIIEAMLKQLATEDEGWRPFWHPNMMWYGPAAFGSFVGIEDFQSFQVPFEAAFEGWGGGMSERTPTRHFTRFGDGNYGCIGGWPSLQGTHVKPYLGFEATGITTLFRVCDWYRREGDLLVENWVFVDIPDALRQWGHDLFEGVVA
jgi:hypothetical protein